MKKIVLLAAATLSSACTTVADVRERRPVIDATSARSVGQLSECVAKAWEKRTGAVAQTMKESGFTMTLTYKGLYGPITAAVVDVTDEGARRSVIVRARKADGGQKLQDEINSCL